MVMESAQQPQQENSMPADMMGEQRPPTFNDRLTAATEGFINGVKAIKTSREAKLDANSDVEQARQRMTALEGAANIAESNLTATIAATKKHRDDLVTVLQDWNEDVV